MEDGWDGEESTLYDFIWDLSEASTVSGSVRYVSHTSFFLKPVWYGCSAFLRETDEGCFLAIIPHLPLELQNLEEVFAL